MENNKIKNKLEDKTWCLRPSIGMAMSSAAGLIKWDTFRKTTTVTASSHVLEVNNATYKLGTLKDLFQSFDDNLENNTLTNSSNILWKKQFNYLEINDNVNHYMKEINTNKNFENFNYEKTAKKRFLFTTFLTKHQSSFFNSSFWNFSLVLSLTLLVFLRILLNFKSKKFNKYFYSIQLMSLPKVVLFIVRYLLLMMFLLSIVNFVLLNTISTSMAAPLSFKDASTSNLKFDNVQPKGLKKNQIIVKVNNKEQNNLQKLEKRTKRRRHTLSMSNDAVENLAKKITDNKVFLLFFDESFLLDKNNGINKFNHWLNLAKNYLKEFGYLSSYKLLNIREFHNAVSTFQDMAGIKSTGHLDEITISQMMQPRCGNMDMTRSRNRNKRFVFISRWENKIQNNVLELTWFIENYTKDISETEIKKTVEKAFDLWSSQINIDSMDSLSLRFKEANKPEDADITILWAEGDHGDSHKFDGPGLDGSNILAHTFYPNYQLHGTLNGDIHLDDYETWNVNNSKEGASFPHVLVHEIGHTLGLGHSKKQKAIMFPIYRKEHLDYVQLDLDDKCAINWSYVGASQLCLFIWLLSEVLPKKIAIESDAKYMIEPQDNLWDSSNVGKLIVDNSHQLPIDSFEARLSNTIIPLCRNENDVEIHLEHMLEQRLHFPIHLAKPYSGVLCRFLNSISTHYQTKVTDNFHEALRIHGVHNYYQFNQQFQALELEELQNHNFDEEFIEKVAAEFMKQ